MIYGCPFSYLEVTKKKVILERSTKDRTPIVSPKDPDNSFLFIYNEYSLSSEQN